MKAVFIKEFGGPENLEIREVEDPPRPQGSEVLIRVKASALNRADILQRKGLYPAPPGYPERIPGLEFAGEVIETGEHAERFKPGDRVFGITAGGAQAELINIDESLLSPIPDNLSFTEAAAIPEAFITASDAIFTQANLKPNETLLIHAVGSGVGLAALQLAKAKGIKTIGTSRTQDKLDKCKEFGLDKGIVIEDEIKFAELSGGADVILDLVGASYFEENLKALNPKGRLMLVGLTAGRKTEFDMGTALSKRLKIIGTVLRSRTKEEKGQAAREFEREVLPLLQERRLKPNIDKVFSISEIQEAHKYLESNASFGKAVIEI